MSEAKNPVRDRVLVLRVLVPSLEARLRDKMEEAEKMTSMRMPAGSNNPADFLTKETLCDLDGVQCEPTGEPTNTRWNFHCDGASYPCRLVNLPCPVELHKTHDHAMYYKSCDIAQLLVVYEDEMAMEEAENMPSYSNEDYPSYYHSGLTPPLKRVVERRFSRREHKAIPPPRTEVSEIEEQLRVMIERISENTAKGKGKNKTPSLSAATAKVIEEVVEELVDYQPWMDDHGREPNGVQFDIEDPRSTKYPELWLEPREINQIMRAETEKEAKLAAKKEEKKAKKKKAKAAAAASGKGKVQQTAAAAVIPPAFSNSPPPPSMDVISAIGEEFNAGAVDELDLDDDALFAGMDDDDILGDMDFGV